MAVAWLDAGNVQWIFVAACKVLLVLILLCQIFLHLSTGMNLCFRPLVLHLEVCRYYCVFTFSCWKGTLPETVSLSLQGRYGKWGEIFKGKGRKAEAKVSHKRVKRRGPPIAPSPAVRRLLTNC